MGEVFGLQIKLENLSTDLQLNFRLYYLSHGYNFKWFKRESSSLSSEKEVRKVKKLS